MGKKKKRHSQSRTWYPPQNSPGKKTPKNLCCSLIPLDTESIKKEFRRECQEARERFENIRKNWDFYDKQERPGYSSWVRLHLGSEFSEFKMMQEEINRKNLIFQELEYRGACRRNLDRTEIYEQLLKELETGIKEPFTHRADEFSEYSDEPEGSAGYIDDEEPWDESDMDEDFLDEFDDMDDDFMDELDDMDDEEFMRDPVNSFHKMIDRMLGHFEGGADPGRREVKKNKIKDVYRDICKKLHPDTGAEFDEKNSSLWHEAQDAYEHRDLERLESVLAICEMKSGGLKGSVTCSQMLEVIAHYNEGVESVRDILAEARHAEDWNFMSWSSNEKQRKLDKLKNLMKKDLDACRKNIEYIEARITRWKMSGKPKQKSKNVKRSDWSQNQMAFDF